LKKHIEKLIDGVTSACEEQMFKCVLGKTV